MTEKQLRKLNIDEKILPLIKELNKVGLLTSGSCQGHPEHQRPAYVTLDIDKIKDFGIFMNYYNGKPGLTIYWDRGK